MKLTIKKGIVFGNAQEEREDLSVLKLPDHCTFQFELRIPRINIRSL